MSSESPRDRLPFEPRQKKKKVPASAQKAPDKQSQSVGEARSAGLSAIPDAVSKRMVRRMALFCGIPTALGLSSFFIFYWIVSHQWVKVPTTAVLLVSLGFFGLGVVGLSYGILSTSWDEDRVGGWWGWEEFRINFGRMTSAWRATKKEARGE